MICLGLASLVCVLMVVVGLVWLFVEMYRAPLDPHDHDVFD